MHAKYTKSSLCICNLKNTCKNNCASSLKIKLIAIYFTFNALQFVFVSQKTLPTSATTQKKMLEKGKHSNFKSLNDNPIKAVLKLFEHSYMK